MEEHINFAPLLLVMSLAFIVPLLLGRVRWLPIVVGEILAGVIIGHSGLNLVGENEILEVFSNIGLSFLMFLAGLEIDFDKLLPPRWRNGKAEAKSTAPTRPGPNVLGFALLVYLFTLALAIPGGQLLNRLGLDGNPWMLAFVLSATSLGVLLPILKQRNLTPTLTGQAVFLTALVADFATVILLTIFLIFHRQGLDLEIFSVGLLFLAFILASRVLGQFFRIKRVRALVDELSHVTVQIKVRGALAILMTFVVLAGLLGVELILGAFLAGMIISLIKAPEDVDLIHKLEAFGYGFFIPVFFIMVGVNLELGTLFESPSSLLLIPVLLVISQVVKTLPALLFRRILPWRETLASSVLLNTHLSLEIAVAVIGLGLGLLSPAASTALVVFSMLTVLIMPVLFNLILPVTPEPERGWMVLFGAEDLGIQVAKVLRQHGELVRFLEPETRLVDQARTAGFEAIHATTISECLDAATKDGIQALLVLSSDDTRNLLVCHAAKRKGLENTIAMVNDPSRLPEYRALNVRPFEPTIYRPPLFALMARSPDIFNLLTTTTDEQDVREVSVLNPLAVNQALRTLELPGNLLVLALNRGGELIIPHGNTRVERGDRLTLLGSTTELHDAINWLECPVQPVI